MKASLLVELHGWRGATIEKDLFCIHLVAGFFTVVVCKLLIMDKFKEFRGKLDEVEKKLRGE